MGKHNQRSGVNHGYNMAPSRRFLLCGATLSISAASSAHASCGVNSAHHYQEMIELGDRWSRAIEIGDLAAVADCYAPDMRIWNNIRCTFMSGAEHLPLMAAMFARYTERKYVGAETSLIVDGFVRQHCLTAKQNGSPFTMPICYVAKVRNGKFTQVQEYITLPTAPQLGSRAA